MPPTTDSYWTERLTLDPEDGIAHLECGACGFVHRIKRDAAAELTHCRVGCPGCGVVNRIPAIDAIP